MQTIKHPLYLERNAESLISELGFLANLPDSVNSAKGKSLTEDMCQSPGAWVMNSFPD